MLQFCGVKRRFDMLKLNRLTDYAVVVLSRLSKQVGMVQTANEISDGTGLPMPTVSKILKLMAGASLIESHRGVNGGYSLTRSAASIRISEIIEALEGPIALTACVDGTTDQCTIEGSCPMRGNWNTVNDAIRTALSSVTLADLLDPGEIFPANSLSKKTNPDSASYQIS